MMPENDAIAAASRETGQRRRWYKSIRCSICTSLIWSRPIAIIEPDEAPEPRQQWMLCQSCYELLLAELLRSAIHSPLRLRIAIGIVAAERSPKAYVNEQQAFQREFAWFTWAMVLFGLLHVAIFIILLAVPR